MIEIDWANDEETVAIWKFRRNWTAEQCYTMNDYGSKMILGKNYSVNVILDFTFSTHSPKNIMPVLSSLFKRQPPNVARIIVFAKTSYWERLIPAVLAGIKVEFSVHFTDDLDETYELVGLYDD